MGELEAKRVDFYSHLQAIDSRTAAGKLSFAIFSAISEFERTLIRERVMAGLARAKAQGKKLGRPSNANPSAITSVKMLRANGHTIHKIAKQLHIGVGTTQKILAAA
jgi:DNA invertase Pin-like site-specific DNA recombinase